MAPLSLNRRILRLALPTILMNISVPLLGAVDTAVVGHLAEIHYLGAVSVGTLMFTVLYWGFGFFRMSTVGLTAQAWGRQDHGEVINILGRAVLLGTMVGLTIILLRGPIVTLGLRLIDATPQVESYAESYFRIRVLAAPAAFLAFVFVGWFYGMNNVAFPVALTVAVNTLNVGLNFWFVLGLGMTSDGVAWATVAAQYAGLVATAGLFWWRYRAMLGALVPREVLQWRGLQAMFVLNGNILLRTLSLLFAHAFFMAQSAAQGELILAVNTILLQFRHIAAYAMDGFATAAEVLVGAAVGRADRDGLLRAIRLSQRWGMLIGVAISGVYLLGSPWLPALFTTNEQVLALAGVYIWWVACDPLVSNIPFILDGVYIGATGTRTMRNTMIFSVFGVFLPLFFVLQWAFGNHGMWAATVLLYAVRGATLHWPVMRLQREPGYSLR